MIRALPLVLLLVACGTSKSLTEELHERKVATQTLLHQRVQAQDREFDCIYQTARASGARRWTGSTRTSG